MGVSGTAEGPEFLFICGAVGSGNTFMFGALTKDSRVYGINEDGLGSTLRNFLRPENESTCPHAVEEYVGFLHRLRRDRRTLILKTPANIRHRDQIRSHLPNCRFIMMIREPHSAIVSGISRHGSRYSIEDIARIWLEDSQPHLERAADSSVVTFQQLVADPVATLTQVSQEIIPLEPEVFKYAERVNRPERAASEWWRSKVEPGVRNEVEHWVRELELDQVYRAAAGATADTVATAPGGNPGLFATARKEFYRAWYRLTR